MWLTDFQNTIRIRKIRIPPNVADAVLIYFHRRKRGQTTLRFA